MPEAKNRFFPSAEQSAQVTNHVPNYPVGTLGTHGGAGYLDTPQYNAGNARYSLDTFSRTEYQQDMPLAAMSTEVFSTREHQQETRIPQQISYTIGDPPLEVRYLHTWEAVTQPVYPENTHDASQQRIKSPSIQEGPSDRAHTPELTGEETALLKESMKALYAYVNNAYEEISILSLNRTESQNRRGAVNADFKERTQELLVEYKIPSTNNVVWRRAIKQLFKEGMPRIVSGKDGEKIKRNKTSRPTASTTKDPYIQIASNGTVPMQPNHEISLVHPYVNQFDHSDTLGSQAHKFFPNTTSYTPSGS